jgi:AbiV family abortive infection protein
VQGRKLYLQLAEASFENSLEFLRDAENLRRRGSRGHAYSLVVLSIEEAAKAYLYKLAGEGVYRIVTKKPNGVSTYSETQLFDHKFKHAIIARLVVQAIHLSPVGKVLSKTRRTHFTRKQVEAMLADLLHEQELMQIRLRPSGRAGVEIRRVFETLEKANHRKNSGFYVGHDDGKIRRPNDCPKKVLKEGFELSGVVCDFVGELLDLTLSLGQKRQAATAVREVASALRVASSKKPAVARPSSNPPPRVVERSSKA